LLALESLLVLLGYSTPRSRKHSNSNAGSLTGGNHQEDMEINDDVVTRKNIMTPAKLSNHTRGKSGSFPQQNTFFSQTPSQAMTEQSKWLDDEQVPMILLPLIEPSSKVAVLKAEKGEIKFLKKMVKTYRLLAPLISLNCVIPEMDFNQCIRAQDFCISRLCDMRRKIPTISPDYVLENWHSNIALENSHIKMGSRANDMPLDIHSVTILKVSVDNKSITNC
jgi:hypothetical protein